jgi:hypothetical protein
VSAMRSSVDFCGAGCNRTAGVLAWGPANLVAYGAHSAIVLYNIEARLYSHLVLGEAALRARLTRLQYRLL